MVLVGMFCNYHPNQLYKDLFKAFVTFICATILYLMVFQITEEHTFVLFHIVVSEQLTVFVIRYFQHDMYMVMYLKGNNNKFNNGTKCFCSVLLVFSTRDKIKHNGNSGPWQ